VGLTDPEIEPGAEMLVPFTAPATGAVPEAAFDEYRVRDIMTPVAFTVRPTDTLGTAVRFLLNGRLHSVLVLEDGVVCGILTPFDILQSVDWE
jgi:CBS-domain-containing membrane protein